MADSSKLNDSELTRVIRNAYESFFSEGLDGFMKNLPFHPDAVMIEADSLPFGGTYTGPEAIRKGIETAVAAWDDFSGRLENVTASGNFGFVYLHLFAKGPKTGKSFSFPVVEVLRFRDGQVVEFRPFYFDTERCKSCFGE